MPRPGPGFERPDKRASAAQKESSPSVPSVAVIGAGVSGLGAAYRLKTAGLKVTVFESSDGVGGKIRSSTQNGYVWETGANTMAENDSLVGDLIEDLHLEEKRVIPRQQNARYIVRDGKPQKMPSNPWDFLTTPLLSTGAKLRMLGEPFLWKRPLADLLEGSARLLQDESFGSFLSRHVGREPVEYLADPFCAGTSGSDPDSLSVRHAFPKLWELEQRHGSLLMGAVLSGFGKRAPAAAAGARRRKKTKGSFSFLGGMQALPNALAERVGMENVRLRSQVVGLACNRHGGRGRGQVAVPEWTVTAGLGGGKKRDLKFDAVIVTVPLHDLAAVQLARDGRPHALGAPPVRYQPMAAVVNAFRAADVRRALPGFGVLVPSVERQRGLRTLGTLFSSAMFPDRAPPGHVLFTTFVGGSRGRDLAVAPPTELQRVALQDLRVLLGVEGTPLFSKQVCWKQAFPEYGRGYGKVIESIEKLERDLPGLYYAGNHVGGLAVGKALVSGYEKAGHVLSDLRARQVY